MKEIKIRKQSWVSWGMLITSGLLILWYFIGPYRDTRIMYTENPVLTVFLGIIFFGLFLIYLRELIYKIPEITLDTEGIGIRNSGWNHWDYVDSVSLIVEKDSEGDNREFLLIHLKDSREIKCLVTDLNFKPGEILFLVRSFKNNMADSEAGPDGK